MFPWESRRTRRSGRDRRRPDIAALVEGLEPRQLLATAPLGTSLPDLTVSAIAGPVASWGNPLAITVNLRNIGSSQVVEPLALAPGSVSSADAPASSIDVFAVRSPNTGLKGAVFVGNLAAPAVAQNSIVQFTQTITLPQRPARFPGDGGIIHLVLRLNTNGDILETDRTNNLSAPIPVGIQAPLPELSAVGFDVPPVMRPGDTIQPNIRIANLGSAATAVQGPVQVAIMASTTPAVTQGSTLVALYTVANVPGQNLVPTGRALFGDANLNPPQNIATITGDPVTLPAGPATYFIGVVVDPFNTIKELSEVPQSGRAANPFSLAQPVGPAQGLPPAGVDVAGGAANVPVFPFPFGGNPVGGLPNGGGFPAPFPPQSLITLARNVANATGGVSAFGVSGGYYSVRPYGASVAATFQNRRAIVNALRKPGVQPGGSSFGGFNVPNGTQTLRTSKFTPIA